MDGDSRNLEKNFIGQPSDMVRDDSSVLQSVRVRHRSILANPPHWDFVESEFRIVLYCGSILWALYLLSQTL
jgi:hypothetical protein